MQHIFHNIVFALELVAGVSKDMISVRKFCSYEFILAVRFHDAIKTATTFN